MVNCSFCNKEIDRLVFCNPSHKVMFHRGKVLPKVNKVKPVVIKKVADVPSYKGSCEHGSAVGLCKFGCS